MRPTTKAVLLSAFAAGTVLALTLWHYGAGPSGAAVAARATARVSALVFSLALANRSRPSGSSLMNGFVSAHAVHYAAVTYLAMVAVGHHLHHLTLHSVLVVAFGVGLLAVLLLSNGDLRPAMRRVNAFAVYAAWAIFLGAALLNGTGLRGPQRWPALIPLPALLLALGYHLYRVSADRRP